MKYKEKKKKKISFFFIHSDQTHIIKSMKKVSLYNLWNNSSKPHSLSNLLLSLSLSLSLSQSRIYIIYKNERLKYNAKYIHTEKRVLYTHIRVFSSSPNGKFNPIYQTLNSWRDAKRRAQQNHPFYFYLTTILYIYRAKIVCVF